MQTVIRGGQPAEGDPIAYGTWQFGGDWGPVDEQAAGVRAKARVAPGPDPTTVADCGGGAAADTWPRQIRIDACPEQGATGDLTC